VDEKNLSQYMMDLIKKSFITFYARNSRRKQAWKRL